MKRTIMGLVVGIVMFVSTGCGIFDSPDTPEPTLLSGAPTGVKVYVAETHYDDDDGAVPVVEKLSNGELVINIHEVYTTAPASPEIPALVIERTRATFVIHGVMTKGQTKLQVRVDERGTTDNQLYESQHLVMPAPGVSLVKG